MNIGFSTYVLSGGQSGIATYIRELLRVLQLEDQHNAYDLLMSSNDADLISLSNPNFKKRITPPFISQPIVNVGWHNIVLPVTGKKYDLIHIPSARRIPLVKGTNVVATVHDLAAFSVHAKYDPARMFFNRKVVPAMIRRADHVIAVSEFTKRDLVRHIGYPEERISVVYSGVDRQLFVPCAADAARERLQLNRPFFVYVSRLEHPAKNHVRLIEAFERFKLENDSSHQLVFAGADWHGAAAIHARAAESPVRGDIRFLGFVEAELLPLLYSACDLMVYPSLFEGFGLPIIEAMACGAAVICSNTSSMKELAGDRIATFNPLDTEALCRCMETAVAAGRNEEQIRRNMDYAATFDWHTTARRVRHIYESLV